MEQRKYLQTYPCQDNPPVQGSPVLDLVLVVGSYLRLHSFTQNVCVFKRGFYLFVRCLCEAKVRWKEGRTEG